MSISSESKKVERKYKRRLTELDSLCTRQIQSLWKKHDSSKIATLRAGLIGKIVGIEWVISTLKSIELKQEREIDKYE
jgi:hypothetical protein